VDPANPTADKPIMITCDVTNTGEKAGDEVVQLYMKDRVASVTPFDQVLRGFERVSLKPDETKTVSFKLNPKRDLKMLNRDNEWVVEPGQFEAKIGTSSAPKWIKLKKTFNLR
jgi:beta-glucosidase